MFAIAGAIIGGYFGGKAVNDGEWNPGKWDSDKTWGGILVGALAGGLGGGLGVGIGGLEGAIWAGIASGSVNGSGTAIINGGDANDIFAGAIGGALLGGFSGAAGYGIMAGAGAIANGIGKSLVSGHGNLSAIESRWGNSTLGWLQLSSNEGFRYLSGNGIQTNIIPEIAMSINGALAGSWGSKRIPVGTWYNADIYEVPNRNNNFSTHMQGSSSSNIQQYRNDLGIISKQINSVDLNYLGCQTGDYFKLSSGSKNFNERTITGETGVLSLDKIHNTYYNLNYDYHPGNISLRVNIRRHGKYGDEVVSPRWRRLFFGL